MNHPAGQSASLLELVFEGRNKKYGAYILRRQHDRTLLRALLYVAATFAFLAAVLHYQPDPVVKLPETGAQTDPADFEITVSMPPLPEEKPEPLKTSSPANADVVSRVIEDEAPALDATETPTSAAGTATMGARDDLAGTGTTVIAPTGDVKPDSVYESYGVEELPEFEGGISALRRFIATHVRFPREEAERAQESTVMIRFVVDERGAVTRVSVLRSGGPAFDREAVRVVSSLPAFRSPARTKGKAVKVTFALPIKFRVE
jgi:periplasmic protein TonB